MSGAWLLLIVSPIVVGVLLFLLARWARRQNSRLNTSMIARRSDAPSEFRAGRWRNGFSLYYFGNLPKSITMIARGLIFLVVLVAFSFFVFVLAKLFG